MTARKWHLAILAASLIGLAHAEYSPLSTHEEGDGMPVAQMGARERAMGEAGMAGVSASGFFLPNISRSAYYERTSFTATLEGDEDWLRDDASANHMATITLPTLATFIKTSKLGTIGAYYQQSYQRRFAAVRVVGDTINQGYSAEGGQYMLGLSWAYSPIPMFAFGVSENIVLSHDRFIKSSTFTDDPNLINAENLLDTTEMNGWGAYPTFSATYHSRRFDAALSYTPEIHLDITQESHISHLVSDTLSDTTRALPMKISGGVAWHPAARQTLVFDLYYEDWTGGGYLNPAYKAGLGYEFRGADNPFEDFRKRISYRGGLGYDVLYLRKVPEVYGTLGLGLPLGRRGHVMDISLKYGHRSFNGDTFFAEDYVKLSASIIGVGTWGQPARKRR